MRGSDRERERQKRERSLDREKQAHTCAHTVGPDPDRQAAADAGPASTPPDLRPRRPATHNSFMELFNLRKNPAAAG